MATQDKRTPELDDTRTGPPFMAGERESLEAWLEFYRETLPLKVGGLTAEQLCRAAVPPSIMTLAGIVRHLCDVERYWFSNVVAGSDEQAHYKSEDPDADFTEYSIETALADVAASILVLVAVMPVTPEGLKEVNGAASSTVTLPPDVAVGVALDSTGAGSGPVQAASASAIATAAASALEMRPGRIPPPVFFASMYVRDAVGSMPVPGSILHARLPQGPERSL